MLGFVRRRPAKSGKRLFVVKIHGGASCCLLEGLMEYGDYGWDLELKENMLNWGARKTEFAW